jgi:hypothetical protein
MLKLSVSFKRNLVVYCGTFFSRTGLGNLGLTPEEKVITRYRVIKKSLYTYTIRESWK